MRYKPIKAIYGIGEHKSVGYALARNVKPLFEKPAHVARLVLKFVENLLNCYSRLKRCFGSQPPSLPNAPCGL